MDVFSLGDKNGNVSIRSRSLPLVKRLNHLYREAAVPRLSVAATGATTARIDADGRMLIEVLPGDILASGTTPATAEATARTWVYALQRALRKGGGTAR